MSRIHHSRALVGKSTTFKPKQGGPNVEDKKLRRFLKESMRRDMNVRRIAYEGNQEIKTLTGSSFLLGNSVYGA